MIHSYHTLNLNGLNNLSDLSRAFSNTAPVGSPIRKSRKKNGTGITPAPLKTIRRSLNR